jgi:hypothetical protein
MGVKTPLLNEHLDSLPRLSALGTASEALLGRVLSRIRRWHEVNGAVDDRLRAIDDLTAILRQQIESDSCPTESRRAA